MPLYLQSEGASQANLGQELQLGILSQVAKGKI